MEEPRSPSLGQVVRKAIEAQAAALRVSLPGRIEKYDPATRRADVKPLVRDVYFDMDGVRQAESLPVVTDVPVVFPGGGGSSLTFPVKPGDVCELLFADSSLDVWKARGGEVDPIEVRPHDLSNGVALVGLQDFANVIPAHADNVVLGRHDGARVELLPSDEIHLHAGGNASHVALATMVEAQLDKITADLSELKAAIVAAPVAPTDGGATFKASLVASLSAFPTTLGSVAASKVKAE